MTKINDSINKVCIRVHRNCSDPQIKMISYLFNYVSNLFKVYILDKPKTIDLFISEFIEDKQNVNNLIPNTIDNDLQILFGQEKSNDSNSERFYLIFFTHFCMFLKYVLNSDENINTVPDLMKTTPDELFTRIIILGQQYNNKNYNDSKKTTLICGLGSFFLFYGNHLRILEEEKKIDHDLFLNTHDIWELIQIIENKADVNILKKKCNPKEFKDLDYSQSYLKHFHQCTFDCIFKEVFTNDKFQASFNKYLVEITALQKKIEKIRPSEKFRTFIEYFIY